jgi:hypothetical protein
MSALSLSALKFAQDALSAGVKGGDPARFRGKEVDAYLASVGLMVADQPNGNAPLIVGPGYPWCAAFVYWCFEQAVAADKTGIAINPCPRTAGALHLYERAPLKCRAALPAPGDVFVLSHGGGKGHTGLVESVSPDSLTVTTVEGDTYATLAKAQAAGDPAARSGDSVGRHTWTPGGGKRGVLLGWLDL